MHSRLLTLISLPLFLTLAACDQLQDIPVGNGYAAKDICSRVFLQGDDFARVRDDYVAPVVAPYSQHWKISIDYAGKAVEVKDKYRLFPKARAFYRDGLGCTLIADSNERTIRQQPFRPLTPPALPHDQYWPLGSAGIDPNPVPGVDYTRVDSILTGLVGNRVREGGKDYTLSALVAYDGQMISERYQPGYDQSSLMTSWSMAKTISGLLMGALYDDGRFQIDDRAPVPAWRFGFKSLITVRHLMNMTPGLKWVEEDTRKEMMFLHGDMTAFAEQLPLEHTPGTQFNYSTGTSTILANIVTRFSGGTVQSAHDFYQERLFYPLGITTGLIEFDASGSLGGGTYAHLTLRDWARLGQLVLQDGNWNGEQVISTDWMDFITTPAVDFMSTPEGVEKSYGGQVWLYKSGTGSYNMPDDTIMFRGFLGQRVIVIPSRKLVMVILGVHHSEDVGDAVFYTALEQVLDAIP